MGHAAEVALMLDVCRRYLDPLLLGMEEVAVPDSRGIVAAVPYVSPRGYHFVLRSLWRESI